MDTDIRIRLRERWIPELAIRAGLMTEVGNSNVPTILESVCSVEDCGNILWISDCSRCYRCGAENPEPIEPRRVGRSSEDGIDLDVVSRRCGCCG